jgi:mannosyl-3-phosphoglycerate phosphatase family protein
LPLCCHYRLDPMKIVITDLDGTLLDPTTYDFSPAQEALGLLRKLEIPLVLCSSKTRMELEYWREQLRNCHPFISENGGAVFLPRHYFSRFISTAQYRDGYDVLVLGSSYPEVIASLQEASQESRCRVRGFWNMTVEEVMDSCHLPRAQAILAQRREFDEPFLIQDPSREASLLQGIEKRGKRWTHGGHFYHIMGQHDKADAAAVLKELYRPAFDPIQMIALGDHLNDVPLLQSADSPIIINSEYASLVNQAVPAAKVTESPGPHGWNEAILQMIQG